ncbi:MAG TPA: peptidyl-prolyl cis-trans isomerase [Thermoanaerobaculia bacterium]|jgi:peptidyl-prolyl cis-trans isomerase C
MNRPLLMLSLVLAAAPLFAQEAAKPAPTPDEIVVASVNGQTISQAKLDQLWQRMSENMRAQYEKNGGKTAFLESYVRRLLVIQEALKNGFDKQPDVQTELEAARDSALFDLYVRDVIAAPLVTDQEVRAFYDQNPSEFTTPERAHVRHILTSAANNHNPEGARAKITQVMSELFQAYRANPNGFVDAFAAAARKYSEDTTSAQNGGDLGWVSREQLDPRLSEGAFTMKTGVMSGIIEAADGFHLLLIEQREPASKQSFDEAKAGIREYLLNKNAGRIIETLTKHTADLRANAKVTLYPDNVR